MLNRLLFVWEKWIGVPVLLLHKSPFNTGHISPGCELFIGIYFFSFMGQADLLFGLFSGEAVSRIVFLLLTIY